MSRTRSSASKRVRARRRIHDPGVYLPPLPPLSLLTAGLQDIVLQTPGAEIQLGNSLQAAPYELVGRGASSLTLNVLDPHDELLGGELLDLSEDGILDQGVTANIADVVYRLAAINGDSSAPLALTFIDDVAWRLQQDTAPLKFSRGQYTRAQAIYRMADQARQPPREWFPIFMPEINDVQAIAKPTPGADGTPGGDPGFSDTADVTVKGVTATKGQRQVLGGVLAEGWREKASDRVLIAAVMTITQESVAGEDPVSSSGRHLGPFHQDSGYGSPETRRAPGTAMRGFLKEWKRVHGSIRNATGDLATMIEAVQRSGSAAPYAAWETEAKRTVKAWNPQEASATGERDVARRFEFTRGTSDGRESSWTATGRLTDEINGSGADGSWGYWATLNAFGFASDEELRNAAPSLTVRAGAPWLLQRSFQWNVNRPVTELTLSVLAREWGLLPNSVVAVPKAWGPLEGRWLVRNVRGKVGSKIAEVVLHRPVAKRPEPAHEVNQRSTGGNGTASALEAAARHISGQDRKYKLGGGHGVPLASIGTTEGLDCSSAVSLALRRADMFPGTQAITSGEFARSWGKPGKGKDFTVWANDTHVWIEGYKSDGSFAWRFDTSAHGSGPAGPKVRSKPRSDQARFTARHWSGS